MSKAKNTKDTFIIYKSFYEALLEVDNKTEAFDYFCMICRYAFENEEPRELPIQGRIIFRLVKPLIDSNRENYENGKKGGRPKSTPQQDRPSDCGGLDNPFASLLNVDKSEAERKRLEEERIRFSQGYSD